MHPAHVKLFDIARRLAPVGLQLAQRYNQEQIALDLETVLSAQRLRTEEGTRQSREALAALRQLTAVHKAAYARVYGVAMDEFAAAVAQLPTHLQDASGREIVDAINWQLDAQAKAYATRERWIDAAEAICDLIDSRRATCQFDAGGVAFADAADLGRFEELLAIIEDTHQAEVAALEERIARFSRACEVLAGKPVPESG